MTDGAIRSIDEGSCSRRLCRFNGASQAGSAIEYRNRLVGDRKHDGRGVAREVELIGLLVDRGVVSRDQVACRHFGDERGLAGCIGREFVVGVSVALQRLALGDEADDGVLNRFAVMQHRDRDRLTSGNFAERASVENDFKWQACGRLVCVTVDLGSIQGIAGQHIAFRGSNAADRFAMVHHPIKFLNELVHSGLGQRDRRRPVTLLFSRRGGEELRFQIGTLFIGADVFHRRPVECQQTGQLEVAMMVAVIA